MLFEAIYVGRQHAPGLGGSRKDMRVYGDAVGVVQSAAQDGSAVRESLEREGNGRAACSAKVQVDQLAASFGPMLERAELALREADAAFRKDYLDVQGRARKALAESAVASERAQRFSSCLVADCATETTACERVFH